MVRVWQWKGWGIVLCVGVTAGRTWATSPQTPFTPPTSHKNEGQLLSDEFNSFAKDILRRWGVPGCSIGAVRIEDSATEGEATVDNRNFGRAGENGRMVDETTLFNVASNTKAFSAATLSLFVDDVSNTISWSSKVSSILPSFKLQDQHAQTLVTLTDILSHRTGMPRHDFSYGGEGETYVSAQAKLASLKPRRELREEWQYNNMMFITLGHIISHLTGISYSTFVAAHILDPLGMTASTFNPHSSHARENLSQSYITSFNGTAWPVEYFGKTLGFPSVPSSFLNSSDIRSAPTETLETNSAAFGLMTNTIDLNKWLSFLIRSHRLATHSVTTSQESGEEKEASVPHSRWAGPVSPNSVLEMATGRTIISGRQSPSRPELSSALYGFGLEIMNYQGVEMVWHGGSTPGFGSQIAWMPSRRVGVSVMCNSWGVGNIVADILTYRAMEELAQLEKRIDWDERMRKSMNTSKSSPKSPPSPTPYLPHTLPVSAYVGIYSNPAYGEFRVCPALATQSSPDGCLELEVGLNSSLPIHDPPSAPASKRGLPELYILKKTTWATYYELWHRAVDVWDGLEVALRRWDREEFKEDRRFLRVYDDNDWIEFTFVMDAERGEVGGMEIRGIWHEGRKRDAPDGSWTQGDPEVWLRKIS